MFLLEEISTANIRVGEKMLRDKVIHTPGRLSVPYDSTGALIKELKDTYTQIHFDIDFFRGSPKQEQFLRSTSNFFLVFQKAHQFSVKLYKSAASTLTK